MRPFRIYCARSRRGTVVSSRHADLCVQSLLLPPGERCRRWTRHGGYSWRKSSSSFNGAEINAKLSNGCNVLHLAVKNEDKDMVRLDIAYGVDIEAKCNHFQAPLYDALH